MTIPMPAPGPASRLTCEHCHGTGYITTALGKLPCLTCSASEVSTRHELRVLNRLRMECRTKPICRHLKCIHKLDANHKCRFRCGKWSIPHHRVKPNQDQSAIFYNAIASNPEATRDHMCVRGNLVSAKGFIYRCRHLSTIEIVKYTTPIPATITGSTQPLLKLIQDQSEVVDNRKEAPLVKELCPVAKNPTDFSRSIEPRLIFGVGKSGNRTVVQVPTVALDGESGIPFAQIKTKNDFKDLDGNYEFVGLYVGIEVGAVQFAGMLVAEQSFDSSWTLISAPQKPLEMSELIPVPAGGPIQEAKE